MSSSDRLRKRAIMQDLLKLWTDYPELKLLQIVDLIRTDGDEYESDESMHDTIIELIIAGDM